jgi:hypothetical protein
MRTAASGGGEALQKGRYTPEHLPKSMAQLVQSMDKYIPYLPQATVDLPKYRYEGNKLMGKGPATEKITFIMMLPWMLRDLASRDFIASLQCECQM